MQQRTMFTTLLILGPPAILILHQTTTKITKCRQTEWKSTAAEYLLVITQYKLQSMIHIFE